MTYLTPHGDTDTPHSLMLSGCWKTHLDVANLSTTVNHHSTA